jgi:ABC-type nitrate/sulfonate/bicarbonate transport system substrate-binding protein
MQRNDFLAGAAFAGAGLIATAGPARAATTVTTQLQWIKDSQNAGWWIADADGYFRAAGIDSNVLSGGPNVSSIAAIVAAGRADVGIDNLERVVDAIAAGSDLVIFGALYQRNPSALMSLPKNPVHTAHDLLGKRLGLQQGAKVFIDAIMTVNHLPLNYSEVVVGSTPDPLLQGACDAYLCFITNQPLQLAERGIPCVTATFDQLGYATYQDCLFCTREYLTKNRATLVRYAGALRHGWLTSTRDPARGAQLATTTYGSALGLDEKKELATSKAQIPLLVSDATRAHGMLWIDKARVAGPIYASMRATGRTHLPPVDRLIDMSILTDAPRV